MFLTFAAIIVSTAISIYFQRTTGNAILGAFISTSQLIILYSFSLFSLSKKTINSVSSIIICFALADLAYGLGVDILLLDLPNKMGCLFYIVPYLLGMYSVVKLGFNAFKKLYDRPLMITSLIIFIITFAISMKTIAIPALTTKTPALPILLQILTVLFTILESAVISVTASLLLITFSIPFQLALFGLLLMHVSDIAMRYQSVDTSLLGITVFTHGWTIGVMMIALGTVTIRNLANEKRKVLPLLSLRGAVILSFLFGISMCGLVFGILSSRLAPHSIIAENTSATLILISSIYFMAVVASNLLNSHLSKISQMIKNGTLVGHDNMPYEMKQISEEFEQFATSLQKERDLALSKSEHLAHDIRSPLGILKFASSHLKNLSQAETVSKEDLSNVVEILTNANLSIREIASDILNDRKKTLNTETIKSSIKEAVEEVKINKLDVSFEVEVCPELPDLNLPGLKVVLTNLLNNSAESSKYNTNVKLNAALHNKMIKLTIQDNGDGIPEELLHKLQNGESITTKTDGNGIGLSSAIAWANGCGLTLDIKSKTIGNDRGTTIELGIPS